MLGNALHNEIILYKMTYLVYNNMAEQQQQHYTLKLYFTMQL